MPVEIVMPRLSDTMEEGTLLRWLKQPGDAIHKGDALAEVETDKANMEVEAFEEGTLSEILIPEGKPVPIGTPIARLTESGEAPEKKAETPKKTKQSEPPVGLPPSKRREKHLGATQPKAIATPVERAGGPSRPIKASPRARKLAETQGIDLTTVQGSGPAGRIVEKDIQRATETPQARQPEVQLSSGAQALSKMRQIIAQRMTESKQQIPHFYVTVSIRADALVKLRDALQKQFKISYNDLIMKACGLALRHHPRFNACFEEAQLVIYPEVNISIAVAVPDGLLTPVLHQVDQLSLAEIVQQSKALVARTQSNQLSKTDLTGGSFTLSNMGMYGVEEFTAIINPPQVAILAVGAIQQIPVVENGMVIPGYQMKLILSVDHRAVNGIEAAEFLGTLRYFLENPALLTEMT